MFRQLELYNIITYCRYCIYIWWFCNNLCPGKSKWCENQIHSVHFLNLILEALKETNLGSHPKEMPTSFCSKLLRCSSASSSGLRCEKLRSFKWLNGYQWTIQIIGDTNVTYVKHILIPRFSDKQPRSALKIMGIVCSSIISTTQFELSIINNLTNKPTNLLEVLEDLLGHWKMVIYYIEIPLGLLASPSSLYVDPWYLILIC